MSFPREYEVSGMELGASGIQAGRGTRVEFNPPAVTKLPREHMGAGSIEERIRVTFLVKLEFEVTVVRGGKYHVCSLCGAVPPPPDAEALVFLLRNHDGDRLVFAAEEDTEEERDRYPCAGWRRMSIEDDEGGLVCPECVKSLREAAAKRRNKR